MTQHVHVALRWFHFSQIISLHWGMLQNDHSKHLSAFTLGVAASNQGEDTSSLVLFPLWSYVAVEIKPYPINICTLEQK